MVDIYTKPYFLESFLAKVDLPDPGGPVTIIFYDLLGALASILNLTSLYKFILSLKIKNFCILLIILKIL